MKHIRSYSESFLSVKKALSLDKQYRTKQEVHNSITDLFTRLCKKHNFLKIQTLEIGGNTLSNGTTSYSYVVDNLDVQKQRVSIKVFINSEYSTTLDVDSDKLSAEVMKDVRARVLRH